MAVITALLLTTLAVTLVISLFWQQQVQVRSMENQRLQLQTKWALRAALDWSRQVLRDDAASSVVDHLGEAWAVPVKQIALDEYVENGHEGNERANATLSGTIVDAQSRFNLANLAQSGAPNVQEIEVYRHLLAGLMFDPGLAELTAAKIAASQKVQPAGEAAEAALAHTADLLSIGGYTPAMLARLEPFVVLLPVASPVNVNTAAPEVLAAQLGVSTEQVAALARGRAQAYFKDAKDFEARAQGMHPLTPVTTSTDHFFVYSTVRIDRASIAMQALIYRKRTGNTTVRWVRAS